MRIFRIKARMYCAQQGNKRILSTESFERILYSFELFSTIGCYIYGITFLGKLFQGILYQFKILMKQWLAKCIENNCFANVFQIIFLGYSRFYHRIFCRNTPHGIATNKLRVVYIAKSFCIV